MNYPVINHINRLTSSVLILVTIFFSSAAPPTQTAQVPEIDPPVTPLTGGLIFIPIIAKPPALPAAPSWGRAIPLTDSSVELDWNDNSTNEQGFIISSDGREVGVGPNVTTAIFDGLKDHMLYVFTVRAYNQSGSAVAPGSVSATTFYKDEGPFAPNWLTAVTLSTSSIRLAWHNNTLNVTNTVQQSINGGSFLDLAYFKNVTANGSYTVVGLTPGTNYRYRAYVKAGAYSNTASANTFDAIPPAAPSLLQSSLLDSTTILLTWHDNSPDETDFHLEQKIGKGVYVEIATLSTNTTSYNLSNRTPGTVYGYRVRAHNTYGYSSYSNETSLITPLPLPNPPANVAITYLAVTELDIAFTNDVNARQINLWISQNGAPYTDAYTSDPLGPIPTSLTNNELTGGTTYCYKLRSLNSKGFSQFTAPVCATTYSNTPPSAPNNLAMSATSSTVALMTFNHSLTNVWGFALSISGDNYNWNEWTTVNTKTVYVTNLEAGRTYYFRVRAYVMANSSSFLYSSYSNTASLTMPGGLPIGPTTFTNTASYPVISMKIDNVQKIQSGGAIPTGTSFKLDLPAGTHSYAYTLGFLDGSNPVGLYDFTGSFSAGSTVNLRNATIGEILTPEGNAGYWVGDYWQDLVPGSLGFCFNNSGGYMFYIDGMPHSMGTAVMTYQPNPGSFILNFSVGTGPNYVATLNETDATFMMRNGPTDWPLVEYYYDGSTCP